MKSHIYILFLCLTLISISCSQKKEQVEDEKIYNKEIPEDQRELLALYDEVIDIHDEVMPKMDDLMQAKGALQEKLDTLRENSPEDAVIAELEQSILDLSEADEAMMNWMRNFKPQDDVEDQKVAIDYYKEEKIKIAEVKEKMLSALEEAKRLQKKEE